jgi:hypothetical protein
MLQLLVTLIRRTAGPETLSSVTIHSVICQVGRRGEAEKGRGKWTKRSWLLLCYCGGRRKSRNNSWLPLLSAPFPFFDPCPCLLQVGPVQGTNSSTGQPAPSFEALPSLSLPGSFFPLGIHGAGKGRRCGRCNGAPGRRRWGCQPAAGHPWPRQEEKQVSA